MEDWEANASAPGAVWVREGKSGSPKTIFRIWRIETGLFAGDEGLVLSSSSCNVFAHLSAGERKLGNRGSP
jgi:hypothetical protein